MEIIEILTLKFKFLVKNLPKSYEKKIHQKASDEKRKNGEAQVLGRILKRDSKDEAKGDPRTVAVPACVVEDERELEFYVETGRNYLRIDNDRDRDINDLLRETKQLVQRMIALMQSVINTLCDCCKSAPVEANSQSVDERIEQLCRLFHYGIKYFVTKTSIYRLYGKNISTEAEDMDKNVRLFMDTFVRLDLASFARIIEKQIGFVCRCITKPVAGSSFRSLSINDPRMYDNEFLLKIFHYVRDELLKGSSARDRSQFEVIQNYSTAFAHILARYLLRKFKNIGGYNKLIEDEDGVEEPKEEEQREYQSLAQIQGQLQKDSQREVSSGSQKYSRTLSLFKLVMEIFARLEVTENEIERQAAAAAGSGVPVPMRRMEKNEDIHAYYFDFIVMSTKYSRKTRGTHSDRQGQVVLPLLLGHQDRLQDLQGQADRPAERVRSPSSRNAVHHPQGEARMRSAERAADRDMPVLAGELQDAGGIPSVPGPSAHGLHLRH